MRTRVLVTPLVALLVVGLGVGSRTEPVAARAAQPPPAQQEFVPVNELPPTEAIPAAPLVIAAYAFVWVALFGYLWSVWRRLAKVERELADVARRLAATQRSG